MSGSQFSDEHIYSEIERVTKDKFINAETIDSTAAEGGPQILQSLCNVQEKYQNIQTAQVFVEWFLKAPNVELNNLRKHFCTHLFVDFRKNNDFFSMVDVLRCRDLSIQKKVMQIIPTLTFSQKVDEVDETNLVDALDTLLLILQQRKDNVDFLQQLYSPILDTFSLLFLKSLNTRRTSTLKSSDFFHKKLQEYKKITSKIKHDKNCDDTKPIVEVIQKFSQAANDSQFKNFQVFEGWPNVLSNEHALPALYQKASRVSVTDLYIIFYAVILQILQHSNQTASTFLKTHVNDLLKNQANRLRRDVLYQPIISLLMRGIEKIIDLKMSPPEGGLYSLPYEREDTVMFDLLCLCKSYTDPKMMFVSFDGIHRLLFKYGSQIRQDIAKELMPPCNEMETLHCSYIQRLVPGLHLNVQKSAENKWRRAPGSMFGVTDIVLHFHIKEREEKGSDKTIHDNELDILSQLQQSETHTNIVRLLAHQIYQSPKFYLLESTKTDLFRTLKQMRYSTHSQIPFGELKIYLLDILSAIKYLHDKNFIHRNIMSRSFSIRNGNVVLTDMTLAKRLIDGSCSLVSVKDICANSIPTRWTAPESLIEDVYNELSDVWMIAMTMYELFTLGSQPFAEMKSFSTDDIMTKVVFHSLRTYKWSSIPENVHKTILQCTRTDPNVRPTVRSLHKTVQSWEFNPESTANPSHLLIDCESRSYPRLDPAEEPEKGIPPFFKALKQKQKSDMRTTYFELKNKRTSGLTAHIIKEQDITPSDPPIISKKRGLIVVKEPVPSTFVENVLVQMSEDFVNKMLLSKFPREEARDTSNDLELKFYLVCSFEGGQSLVDMARTQGYLERNNNGENRYLKVLYEVTNLVLRLHEKRWLFRNLCAQNIYISSSSQKAYFTRVSRMVRLPVTSNGVYHEDRMDDEMVHWYPREVLINGDFSKSSDVYMLAMCFYEFFATIEIIKDDLEGNILQRVPYADTSKSMILEKIFNGEKLGCPEDCPEWLYKIMVSCWSRDVTKRPSIEDIQQTIVQRLSEETSPTILHRSVNDSTSTLRPQSENVPSTKIASQQTKALSASEKSRTPVYKAEQWRDTDQSHLKMNCHALKLNTRSINMFSRKTTSEDLIDRENPIFESASSTILQNTLGDDAINAADGIINESSADSDDEIIFENDSDSD